ncbi:unnamed protein product, partial [Didymodactylos carnosus]
IMTKHLTGYQNLPLVTDANNDGQSTTQLELGHPAYVSYIELTPPLADKLRELSTIGDCSDTLVGSVLSTRMNQNAPKELFAPLINTLALRTILPENDDATLLDIIERVKETVLMAMENQTCSFADIVSCLRMANESSKERQHPFLPVFRVLFEMNSYRHVDRQHQFDDGSVWTMNTDLNMIFPFTKSDIDMHAVETGLGSTIHISFRVNVRLLKPATIEKLVQCFFGVVEIVVREPRCTKRTLWNDLHVIRSNLVIHECLLDQVRRNSNEICIIQDNIKWSFRQLYDLIKSVAVSLQQKFNVQSGSIVALCMHRSTHLIAAMFGVLMTGAGYVYVDPTLPFQRILKLIELTSSTLVLCDNDAYEFLNVKLNKMIKIALINELYQLGSLAASYICPLVKPTDICYIIFTSGTTGEPKGIRIQHQAVVRRTHMHEYLRIQPSSRVAHVSSCSFDGYILEVYAALLNGACVVIYKNAQVMEPRSLARLFKVDGIMHAFLPTPIFNMMAEYVPNAFSNMISVMSAGDRANAKLMRRVLSESDPPPQQLINAYGPSETTCISTWYYVTLSALNTLIEHGLPVPIGSALPDTPLYIVRPNTLQLDDDGELLVGGFGVSPGYLNLSDRTDVKCLPTNPFSATDHRPLYRAGDHVHRLSDGNLQFIGRYDNQVKIDSCRIELSEIESHIKHCPDVLDAVVTVRNDVIPNTESIVAYIKPTNISPLHIRQHLSNHLPRYMIPTCIVPVSNLPIVGGKIDRSSLPKPDINAVDHVSDKLLKSAEKSVIDKLQDAWQHVLGSDRSFKHTDDFFLSGRKSFTVVHLHSMLETLFHIELDIIQLFVHTTFASQLQWLMSIETPRQSDSVVASEPILSSNHQSCQSITYDKTNKIAIIGMSARYGPVETVEDLWTELCNGSDLCTRVLHDELSKQEHLREMLKCCPNYVQARCMMTNANCFDHVFFKMTKRDADITDPQHRILLEAAYEALEDAGIIPEEYGEIGNMTDGAPTFVAYKLGLTGPAMALQTACSSSGTALHVALRCIEAGDCDVALVAGATRGWLYSPARYGHVQNRFCRSFDERADGVVGGDGVAVIVLMRSQEAIRSGYSIRSIITGHAINNDGYKKNSFAITNSDMQAACMSRALRTANIEDPISEVVFVEAHGSGTSLGDLLEVQALTKAYGDENNSTSKIHLGSVKTNIGHAAHAGTLASLIKATLVVETGIIPPTVHFQKFSPLIAHLKHPFIVNSTCVKWPHSPRRAAVSTLGQGGTNSHFILEQFMPSTNDLVQQMSSHQIFVLSAKDLEALKKIKKRLAAHLTKLKAEQHDHLAYTLACGRKTYEMREFIVAMSLEDLHQKLTVSQSFVQPCDTPVSIVFLLPGQGAQFVGMARNLHKNYPVYAKIVEECLNYIKNPAIRQSIVDCLLTTEKSMPSELLVQCYAQLSLFITEYALANLFIALNIKPNYLIGHSSGEIVAACLAHVFTVEDAINLLEYRCELMTSSTLPRSSMLAVQIHDDIDELRQEFQIAPPCFLENQELNPFLNCLGFLWSQGAAKNIHWSPLFYSAHLQRISLPTYPFKRIICVANNHPQLTDFEKLIKDESTCMYPKSVSMGLSVMPTNVSSQSTNTKAPWNVRQSNKTYIGGCSIKMIEFSSERIHHPVTMAYTNSLQSGFYTSIFTRALYFEFVDSGIIEADTLLIDLLPEDMPFNLPTHVTCLTLKHLADGSSGLLPPSCNSVQDLLNALGSCAVSLKSNRESPDIFAISLLGHSLAAIVQMSYVELIYDKIIYPLNLSGTEIFGNETFAPAVGLSSTIGDMEYLLTSVYGKCIVSRLPILNGIRKAFENYNVPLIGTEQIVPILHLDTAQALLVTSTGNIPASTLQSIVQKTFGHAATSTTSKRPWLNFRNVIMECLCQLTGSKTDHHSLDVTFEQFGVDSLQAITLVDLLSRRLNRELPVDIVYKYPTIDTLSDRIQQLMKVGDCAAISAPTNYILSEQAGMPKVYLSTGDRSLSSLLTFIDRTKSQLLNELTRCGALLFRDFDVTTSDQFAQVAQALAATNKSFLDYKDGISKRLHIAKNVFTSTEYPKHADMALHNEMSYATEMPTQILFFCEVSPASGCGDETPIGDSREIYRSIDPMIRAAFINRRLLYIHNMPNHDQGIGKSWQDTYQTESREEVERFLREKNIDFIWLPNGGLRTTRSVDAVKKHPLTGDWLWCNHAHLFHPSDLPLETRRTLEARLKPMDMPKNCFFADNKEAIPVEYLTHVRQVLQTHQIKWTWQRGDVLVLDNYRTAHGRAAFSGDCRILVAMC